MLKRCSFILLSMLVWGCFILTAQERSSKPEEGKDNEPPWMSYFADVDPPKWPFEYYIWMPRRCYLVGEPIPLYIEVVARRSLGPSIPNPISLNQSGYHLNAVKDRKINLVTSSKRFGFACVRWVVETPLHEGDYIVAADEIPFRLHGNFVMPRKTGGEWSVDLEPGDCYVMKINDITELWYMHLMDPEFDPRGYYQVQFECSNIIEFEIR